MLPAMAAMAGAELQAGQGNENMELADTLRQVQNIL
jgi:hypothetical protein